MQRLFHWCISPTCCVYALYLVLVCAAGRATRKAISIFCGFLLLILNLKLRHQGLCNRRPYQNCVSSQTIFHCIPFLGRFGKALAAGLGTGLGLLFREQTPIKWSLPRGSAEA